jgi:NTP pyrophosphatase (non-canonical NTP hydrolase)
MNEIVKALRNGFDRRRILKAVRSELPDVIIYSYVLAHVLDIDLTSLVNRKVAVVVKRAADGYYGGPIRKTA